MWQFESSNQNPIGNHLFSVTHLLHNLTRSQARIAVYTTQQGTQVSSYYYYHNDKNSGRLPADHELIGEYSVEM